MSADSELLERAAKAAGISLRLLSTGKGQVPFSDGPRVGEWNPLTDDGDALRLAVDLQLDVYVRGEWVEAVGPMGAPQKVHYNARHKPRAEGTSA